MVDVVLALGREASVVVSILAYYYDDLSLNPESRWLLNFSVLYLEKTKINEKEPGVGPLLKNVVLASVSLSSVILKLWGSVLKYYIIIHV